MAVPAQVLAQNRRVSSVSGGRVLAASSSRGVKRFDPAVARMLRVQPQPAEPGEALAAIGGRPFETPLLLARVLI